mmetsp:Transcript_45793/g.33518  ORF Transcript_45793/g.33518 Transcript_45793/m.33518 type:complete len:219 (-) Transcript_45793:274-930(-)
MWSFYIRAFLRKRDLDRSRPPRNEVSKFPLPDPLKGLVDLSGVYFSLDDVEDRDVSSLFDAGGHNDVLGLEESAHDVEDSSLPDGRLLLVHGERSVASHEEVAPGSGDKRGHESHQVVVHVSWISERGGGRRHYGAHDRVCLREGRLMQFQPVCSDPSQSIVVYDNTRIRIQDEPLQTQQAVVRLDHHIVVIREHRIGLNELLWISIIDLLQQVGAKP